MLGKIAFLHLRWFGLFAFVGFTAIALGHVQNRDAGKLGDPVFWLDLLPIAGVCAVLALIVPWAVFFVDPRRSDAPSYPALLKYWKML